MFLIQFTGSLIVPRITVTTDYDCGDTLEEAVAYGQRIAAQFLPNTYSRMAIFDKEETLLYSAGFKVAIMTEWRPE